MQRARVDLPHPVSPTKPSTSPLKTTMSTSSTALTVSGTWPRRRAMRESLRGKYLRSARTSSWGAGVATSGRMSVTGHHRIADNRFHTALRVDAGRVVIVADRQQREVALAAVVLHVRAARMETATGGWGQEVRRSSRDGVQRLLHPFEPRDRTQEAERIRVPRPAEDLVHRADLDDLRRVHDGHPLAEFGYDGQVVGDVQDAEALFALHGREDVELSLIHISEPTRLGMISYAVFCLKKKKKNKKKTKKKFRIKKK